MTDETCVWIAVAILNVVAAIVIVTTTNEEALDKFLRDPPRGRWVLPLFLLFLFITPAFAMAGAFWAFKRL